MSNSTLRRTTFFKLSTKEEACSSNKAVQSNNNSVEFPNLRRNGKAFTCSSNEKTSKKFTRPRNQFVLMRTLFNRCVTTYILEHFNQTKIQKNMFSVTSKITSELWNESPSELKVYFLLLATLEEKWHKNKHYCSWDKQSSQTLSMEPIENSHIFSRLAISLSMGVGSAVSSYSAKDLCLFPKTRTKKKRVASPTLLPNQRFNSKFNSKLSQGTKTKSPTSLVRLKSTKFPTQSGKVFKKRYQNENRVIEDLFLV